MGPIAGKLFDKFSPKVIIVPGIVLVGIAMFLFKGITLIHQWYKLLLCIAY